MEGLLLLVVGAILLASLLGAFAAGRTGLPLKNRLRRNTGCCSLLPRFAIRRIRW